MPLMATRRTRQSQAGATAAGGGDNDDAPLTLSKQPPSRPPTEAAKGEKREPAPSAARTQSNTSTATAPRSSDPDATPKVRRSRVTNEAPSSDAAKAASLLQPPATPGGTRAAEAAKLFCLGEDKSVRIKFLLQPSFGHVAYRDLKVAIRKHGGEVESRMGHADVILADVARPTEALKLRKEAKQLGQPIPVVLPQFVFDCIEADALLDWKAAKYDPEDEIKAQLAASSTKPGIKLNGRNAYTAEDRAFVVEYFAARPEPWNLNGAARDFAIDRPSHTKHSWLSFLQDNLASKWNIRQQVYSARGQTGQAPSASGSRAADQRANHLTAIPGGSGAPNARSSPSKEHEAHIDRNLFTSSDPVEEVEPADGWNGSKPAKAADRAVVSPTHPASANDATPKGTGDPGRCGMEPDEMPGSEATPTKAAVTADQRDGDDATGEQPEVGAEEEPRGNDAEKEQQEHEAAPGTSSVEVEEELEVRPPRPVRTKSTHHAAAPEPASVRQTDRKEPASKQSEGDAGDAAADRADEVHRSDTSSSFEEAPFNEESEPEGGWQLSPSVAEALEIAETKSRRGRRKQRTAESTEDGDSSDSEELAAESEIDELAEGSENGMATAKQDAAPATEAAKAEGRRSDRAKGPDDGSDYDPNYGGGGAATLSSSGKASPRVKFTSDDKMLLVRRLGDLLLFGGSNDLLDRPPAAFWESLEVENPRHSAASWLSHFNKNKYIYGEAAQMSRYAEQETQLADNGDDDAEGRDEASARQSQAVLREPDSGEPHRPVSAEPRATADAEAEAENQPSDVLEQRSERGPEEDLSERSIRLAEHDERADPAQGEAYATDSDSASIDLEAWNEMERRMALDLAEAERRAKESSAPRERGADASHRTPQPLRASSSSSPPLPAVHRPTVAAAGTEIAVTIPSLLPLSQRRRRRAEADPRPAEHRDPSPSPAAAAATPPQGRSEPAEAEVEAHQRSTSHGDSFSDAYDAPAVEHPAAMSQADTLATPSLDQRREHHEAKAAARAGDPNAKESNRDALASPTLAVTAAAAASSPAKGSAALRRHGGGDLDDEELLADAFDLGDAEIPVLWPASPLVQPEVYRSDGEGAMSAAMRASSPAHAVSPQRLALRTAPWHPDTTRGDAAARHRSADSDPFFQPTAAALADIADGSDGDGDADFQSLQQSPASAAEVEAGFEGDAESACHHQTAFDAVPRAAIERSVFSVSLQHAATRTTSSRFDAGRTADSPAVPRTADAGIPVLDRHRDTTFYDFTMASDEEADVRAEARREQRASLVRPSALARGVPADEGAQGRSVLKPSHLGRDRSAVLSPAQRERVEEWASRTSAELDAQAEPRATARTWAAASSRPRASYGPAAAATPSAFGSPLRRSARASLPSAVASGDRTEREAAEAKRRYTESVRRLCCDFGLSTPAQVVPFMMPNGWDVAKARQALTQRVALLAAKYGVTVQGVIEFVRTAEGRWEEAEKYLGVLARTPGSSTRNGASRGLGGGGASVGDAEEMVEGSNASTGEGIEWESPEGGSRRAEQPQTLPRKRQRTWLEPTDAPPRPQRQRRRRHTRLGDEDEAFSPDAEADGTRTSASKRPRHPAAAAATAAQPHSRSSPEQLWQSSRRAQDADALRRR
ncbi:hypothetical protein ACQY0O_002413 [Thecaphora frezii]